MNTSSACSWYELQVQVLTSIPGSVMLQEVEVEVVQHYLGACSV